MLIEIFLLPLFELLKFFLGMLSVTFDFPNWFASAADLISTALFFFPGDVWKMILSNVVFWINIHFFWAVIEWAYKKIPGVD